MSAVAKVNEFALRDLKDRVEAVEKEISGVKSLFNISQFELDVMKSMKPLAFGSPKQRSILNNIEIKVFGRSREYLGVK